MVDWEVFVSKFDLIRSMPTTISSKDLVNYAGTTSGIHESILKSWNILCEVKIMLAKNTAPELILELITHMEETPEGKSPQ